MIKSNLETRRFNLIVRSQDELLANTKLSVFDLVRKYSFTSEIEAKNEVSRCKRLLRRDPNEYFLWDIYTKENDIIIGNLGFHNFILNHKRSEVGYWCHYDWRNIGVIYESLQEVIKFGFKELHLNRIEAYLDKDNVASERVLQKSNFTKEGLLREHYIDNNKVCDSYIYSLILSDYKK